MNLTSKEAINEARLPTTKTKQAHAVYKTEKGYSFMPQWQFASKNYVAILRHSGDSIIVEDKDGKRINEFSITKKKPILKNKAKSKRVKDEARKNVEDKSEEILSSDGNGESETPIAKDS